MDSFLVEIPVPSMGATVNELTVIDIMIEDGQSVTKGEHLAELESDKSVFEFEAPCDGTIRAILCRAGDIVLSGAPFELAHEFLGLDKVLSLTRDWIMEDKASFLPKVLNNPRLPLSEVATAVHRFHHLLADGAELSQATLDGIRVSLIRRFLNDQLNFISIAKKALNTDDFIDLIDSVLLSETSHGRVGGKSAGLFLAERIIHRRTVEDPSFPKIKVPRTWYIASEGMMAFIDHNDLDEVFQQKYREVAQVRHLPCGMLDGDCSGGKHSALQHHDCRGIKFGESLDRCDRITECIKTQRCRLGVFSTYTSEFIYHFGLDPQGTKFSSELVEFRFRALASEQLSKLRHDAHAGTPFRGSRHLA